MDQDSAYSSLMKGIKEFDLRALSVPSDLVLIGDHAFPLVMNSKGQAFMAASLYGSGRIVVLGHEDYLTTFPVLVENAVTWLRGASSDNLSVGVHTNVKAVAENLKGFKPEVVEAFKEKPGVGVYVTDAYNVGADTKDLVKYIKNGGGVLIAGQACQWASHNSKDNTLHTFPGNTVAGVTGIYFSDDPGEREVVPVHSHIPASGLAIILGKKFADDLQFLLQGVTEFALPTSMTLSEILVHGRLAFPIGSTGGNQAFLAGAYFGQGRVIVASHDALIGQENMATFWKNALLWLDEGRRGVVGIQGKLSHSVLGMSGLKCEKTEFKPNLSVFVCSPNQIKDGNQLMHYVAEGGGLLVAGHCCNWTRKFKNVLTCYQANKLVLNPMGMSLSDATVQGGTHRATVPSQVHHEMYHFRRLLYRLACHVTLNEKLTKQEEGWLKKLASDCTSYLRMKANDCCAYAQVMSTLTEIYKTVGLPQVNEGHPAKTVKDHVLLTILPHVYKSCPKRDGLLSYLTKDQPMLPVVQDHVVKIDVVTSGVTWISTGLYLSPCMTTFLTVPPEIVGKNWKVQIGCQTDLLKAAVLKRAPCVHVQFPVKLNRVKVHNLWGGLIYLVAPPKCKVKGLEVVVQKAVPAPYYKSGVTTLEEWASLRTAPSPWAELEFENIILTVPSEAIRKLERPDHVAEFWDKIMRGIADLAGKSQSFPRKERFVTDVQISHGWMHSGYPIMAHKSTAGKLINIKQAKVTSLWGFIHELGHNQQRGCWEFRPHTTEATCNLWSVYVHEEVIGLPRAKAHKALNDAGRKKRASKYIKDGRKLTDWTIWTALETYLQLQEKFGWDAFKKVHKAYLKMTKTPKVKQAKMNLYATTFSQTVGMNLCEFFKAWGWLIDASTEEKLSQLPPWTDHPMAVYN
ncbi:TRPM8 channel-associated factor homolog [Gouania willdenowi]|uniref:TRPM8 channel-associated factor homolog n=1 Tax=Gouania willdenowi TaxID=441366 RepID=UPI001056C77D|nr:TRPM8 channel-associated factor homolog [Gouania willdenowi]